jgi:protein-disulfide isomerase
VGAYNSGVNSLNLNRLTLLLAFAGLFVAGTLSLGHLMQVSLPCGANSGCDTIAKHPSSFWFNLPIAYFGLGAYATFVVLGILRIFDPSRKLLFTNIGYVLSAIGTLISIYLQYVAIVQIGARCDWCLASAGIMILLLISHALLVNQIQKEEGVKGSLNFDGAFIGVLALVLAVGITFQSSELRKRASIGPLKVNLSSPEVKPKLVPADAAVYGNPLAPITIVEFADIYCPGCKESIPKIKEFIDGSNGKIRWVYRHYPILNKHPHSFKAAAILEHAATKDMFFPLLLELAKLPMDDFSYESVQNVALQMGMSQQEIDKVVSDQNDPAFNRAYRDLEMADTLGINSTPTLFILADGIETKVASSDQLPAILEREEYQQILKSNGQTL